MTEVEPDGELPDGSPGAGDVSIPAIPSEPAAMPCDRMLYAASHHMTTVSLTEDEGTCLYAPAVEAASRELAVRACSNAPRFRYRIMLEESSCGVSLQSVEDPALCLADGQAGQTVRLEPCAKETTRGFSLVRTGNATYRLIGAGGKCIAAGDGLGAAPEWGGCAGSGAHTMQGIADDVIQPQDDLPDTTSPPITLLLGSWGLNHATRGPSGLSGVRWEPTGWLFSRPGAYVDLDVTVVQAGWYVVSAQKSSWFGGIGLDLLIDGTKAGELALGLDRDRGAVSYADPVSIEVPADTRTIRLQAANADEPKTGIPFIVRDVYFTNVGRKLERLGEVTELSPSSVTELPLEAVSNLYRFVLERHSSGATIWTQPKNRSFLSYRIRAERAGDYALVVSYATAAGTDNVNVTVRPVGVPEDSADIRGQSIALTAHADATRLGTAVPLVISVPSGISELRLTASATDKSVGVKGFAIASVQLEPR